MSFEHGEPEEERYDKERYLDGILGLREMPNYMDFVIKGRMPLSLVPVDERSCEVCAAAVETDPQNILSVPETIENHQELWNIAVERCASLFYAMPKEYQNKGLCYRMVFANPTNIKYCSPEFIERQMVIRAIVDSETGVMNVPRQFLDKDLCLMMVRRFPHAVRFVPMDFRDYDLYLCAVKHDREQLLSVPPDFMDWRMCLAAIGTSGGVQDIWNRIRDYFPEPQFLIMALEQNHRVIECISDGEWDREVAMAVIKNIPEAITIIPEKFLTKKDWRDVVIRKPELVKVLANRYWISDPEFYLDLLRNGHKEVIRMLPLEMKEKLVKTILSDDQVASALKAWN